LAARQALHSAFSTAGRRWPYWVFDRLGLVAEETVVEFGAGTGVLWRDNAERLPAGVRLLLTDRSAAMCQALRQIGLPGVLVAGADAERPPLASAVADLVVANHMLYHLRRPQAALAEMARMLRPGGRAVVATNGAGHLRQLRELLTELDIPVGPPWHSCFPLETAPAHLGAVFDRVDVHEFDNALHITDPGPVLGYVASLTMLTDQQAQQIHDAVADRIATAGVFHVDTASGLLIASTT
jgi:SAM-dependent methyltransferase